MNSIQVGNDTITAEAIARELQYHPAEQMDDAWQAAATSLVVKTLLEQRANELGIEAATRRGAHCLVAGAGAASA